MSDVITWPGYSGWRKEYRYSLYAHRLIAKNGEAYTRHFIVIKNRIGMIVHFTTLHNYVGIYDDKVFVPLVSDAETKLRYVCVMLNYVLVDKYDKFQADHVFKVSRESLECFFRDYAQETLPGGNYRGAQSIEKCARAVVMFFRKLRRRYGAAVLLCEKDLVVEKIKHGRHGKPRTQKLPAFQVKGFGSQKSTFRELPTKAFAVLLNLAFRYAEDIVFAICLQAFAGLRAGEAMSVRQEGSPLGSGLIVTFVGSEVRKIEVDLTKEFPLRSDGVICGKIKKERRQCVYPPFIKAFNAAYEHHRAFLAGKRFEPDYCPMFVNGKGLAMTYDDYDRRFSMFVNNHFRPALLENDDPECRIYGQLLYENKLGLHALRHWYSVQLVLCGEDIAQIQYWRGDRNPGSAFEYLQNKGDLLKELESTGEIFTSILMAQGQTEMAARDES